MANLEHLELFRQGVEAWNAWRTDPREVYVHEVDLIEADLNLLMRSSTARSSTARLFGTILAPRAAVPNSFFDLRARNASAGGGGGRRHRALLRKGAAQEASRGVEGGLAAGSGGRFQPFPLPLSPTRPNAALCALRGFLWACSNLTSSSSEHQPG
jgi:hypothetical protein